MIAADSPTHRRTSADVPVLPTAPSSPVLPPPPPPIDRTPRGGAVVVAAVDAHDQQLRAGASGGSGISTRGSQRTRSSELDPETVRYAWGGVVLVVVGWGKMTANHGRPLPPAVTFVLPHVLTSPCGKHCLHRFSPSLTPPRLFVFRYRDEQRRMDVRRSFTKLTEATLFQSWVHAISAEERIKALERVLKAISHLISYSQGMNYIGAIFLLEVGEEDAFALLAWTLKQRGMGVLYAGDCQGLLDYCKYFEGMVAVEVSRQSGASL